MKHFRLTWDQIMMMSWDNYTMVLASIPKYSDKPDEEVEEVDLFDLHK